MGAAHLLNLGSDGGRGHGHREGRKKSLVADRRVVSRVLVGAKCSCSHEYVYMYAAGFEFCCEQEQIRTPTCSRLHARTSLTQDVQGQCTHMLSSTRTARTRVLSVRATNTQPCVRPSRARGILVKPLENSLRGRRRHRRHMPESPAVALGHASWWPHGNIGRAARTSATRTSATRTSATRIQGLR
jgi:hypothetical protein